MSISEELRLYMAELGRKGGAKSKRKMSKREGRRMARIRWDKQKDKQPQ